MVPLSPASWDLVPEILEILRKNNNWPDYKTSYNKVKGHNDVREKFAEHECLLLTPGGQLDPSATFVLVIAAHRYELHVETLAPDLEEFADALASCTYIDWKRSPSISCLHVRLHPVIEHLTKRLPQHTARPFLLRSFHISKEQAHQLILEVPDEVRLERLTEASADFINSQWPHGKTAESRQEVVDYIKFRPSVGLFTKDTGELVAWCLYGEYGGAGLLHVLDQHRRKGYGEVCLVALTKISAEMGQDPHAFIVPHNTASIKLFSKLGYVEMFPAERTTFVFKDDKS